MKRSLCFALLAAAVVSTSAAAPDVEALRQRGCKVVEVAGTVTELSADVKNFTEADYRAIAACTGLRKLNLNGNTLTDETLPLLRGLVALEEFTTNGTKLSDAGYAHFQAFKNLRVLHLWHPSFGFAEFTGAGLIQLKPLEKLERLTFAGATAGDAALQAIGQLTQLRAFQTWHTGQTAAGHAHLAGLFHLQTLKMGQRLPKGNNVAPSFDARAIPVFAKLPALTTLELFEAVFTAQDLLPLKEAKQLKLLKLHTTDIAATEVEALRQALPGVKIDFKPLTPEEREATLRKKLKLNPGTAGE